MAKRRQFIAALAAGSASALAGCGGGGGESSPSSTGTGTGGGTAGGGTTTSGQQLSESFRFNRGDSSRTASFPDRAAPDQAVSEAWTFETEDGLDGAPIAAGGAVYAVAGGTVYAVNPFDGSEWWQQSPGALAGSLAVVDGTLFVPGKQNQLYALDATTGEQQWQYETEDTILKSPVVADGTVFQASASSGGTGKLTAIDASNGDKQWEKTADIGFSLNPAVRDKTVYHMGDNGVINATSLGGENQWSAGAGALLEDIAVSEGTLYGTFDRQGLDDNEIDAGIVALETSDQQRTWNFRTENEFTAGPPAIGDGAVYMASNNTVYKIDDETGESEWTTTVSGGISAAPVKYGDTLLVAGNTLTALDPSDGSELWSTESGTGGGYEPVLVDDTVYVSNGNELQAYE